MGATIVGVIFITFMVCVIVAGVYNICNTDYKQFARMLNRAKINYTDEVFGSPRRHNLVLKDVEVQFDPDETLSGVLNKKQG